MTLRIKLLGAFAAVTVLLLVPAILAVHRLSELRGIAVEERGKHAAASLALGRYGEALSNLDRYERSYVAVQDPQLAAAVRGAVDDLDTEVALLREAGFPDAAGPLARSVAALKTESRRIQALVEEGRTAEATEAFPSVQSLVLEARARLEAAARVIDRRAVADFERAEAISSAAGATTILAILISVALVILLATWSTGAIISPVESLATALGRVTEGSFDAPEELPYDRRDEIGQLASSFRTMTRRLAELDRMKAEFVGVAGHELKTPINVIRGYAELIEEELAGELTPGQAEILHAIAEQTEVMTRLVSRLMDISRLEAGTYVMEPERVHLEDLFTGLARSFDVVAEQKGVDFRVRIHDSAPETLVVDVDMFRDEALGNLVSNAVKFTPEGGEVRVEARGSPGHVVVEVSDTGPGIPEEHRAQVFEKYYQVKRSRRMGSGLGLAIAREMVEIHGGTIELVATPGPGATFRVTLPLRPPEPAEETEGAQGDDASDDAEAGGAGRRRTALR